MADSDVSLDREGQRAVDGAQEADVSGGQEVGQHVDPEHLNVFLLLAGPSQDVFLLPHIPYEGKGVVYFLYITI